MKTKRKSAKVKVHKFPKGYQKLIEGIAMIKMIRDSCRQLGVKLRPETKEERSSHRADWKKLRSLKPPEDQPKLRRLVNAIAREITF